MGKYGASRFYFPDILANFHAQHSSPSLPELYPAPRYGQEDEDQHGQHMLRPAVKTGAQEDILSTKKEFGEEEEVPGSITEESPPSAHPNRLNQEEEKFWRRIVRYFLPPRTVLLLKASP